jgi:predicted NBD/HSP70 family sugar kinase
VSNEALSRSGDETTGRRGQVLSLLRDHGPLTRTELARRAGLSATTMTRVVSQLIGDGSVEEGATVSRSGTGRPGTNVSIVPGAYRVIGIQIGVGFVRGGVVDVMGRCSTTIGFDYRTGSDAAGVLGSVVEAVATLSERAGVPRDRLLGIGVAVPGPVDQERRRLLMPINLPWRDVAVADRLEPASGLPTLVEHNVRSMALAEARFGAARDAHSVAFVYLRTGIGAGLVIAGQGFQGGVHGAIELGHLRVVDGGAPCVCGGRGCLETVVSERALRATLGRLGLDDDGREPLAALIGVSARRPDVAAELDRIVGHLAAGLAALVNLLTPEVIVLGGAFSTVPDAFIRRLADGTREATFPTIRPSVTLRRSSLGMDGGVNGAATTALDHFFYA